MTKTRTVRRGEKSFRFTWNTCATHETQRTTAMTRQCHADSCDSAPKKEAHAPTAAAAHRLQQRLARAVLASDVVTPHVDEEHVRGGHGKQRRLLLKRGVVFAALPPVRALQVHHQRAQAVRVLARLR
jgi:hypothetical protein